MQIFIYSLLKNFQFKLTVSIYDIVAKSTKSVHFFNRIHSNRLKFSEPDADYHTGFFSSILVKAFNYKKTGKKMNFPLSCFLILRFLSNAVVPSQTTKYTFTENLFSFDNNMPSESILSKKENH